MSDPRFEVLAIEDLAIDGACVLDSRELLSPYVWRESGQLGMLLRAVPRDEDEPSSRIWYGTSDDGLRFTMADAPVIVPSLSHLDAGGCEDPTVIDTGDRLVVFYTGVDEKGAAEMLWATGADAASLEKRGIAYHCSKTEKNTKEASILRRQDGAWCVFYEYPKDERSNVGFTIGHAPDGPWEDHDDPFAARSGGWDDHHLSTGPLIEDGDEVLMFYNGATKDARWAIGWSSSTSSRCGSSIGATSR